MPKKMLIDAAHPEETRVAVLDGTRVDDFDFETQSKRQLRGNIYLAKVTRVEPSLQAAFVEFGGNRHGFLAFGEIHPDYYQIPSADREALKAEFESFSGPASADEGEAGEGAEDDDDDDAEAERRRRVLTRRYKIQEVIRRRQIMLVQVVKEERGNKGAALTTYLSLAGRYCVLMPNSGRGGGISRKISAGADRKRLKKIATELEVPHGMGLIVRTAGAKRTKTEIKRDYEYLMRAWETIRDATLKSIAPAMIYEEFSLVKRAIRDLYDKDVEEIYVEGEAAYREAKDFVRMLMPSHAKKVHYYRDATPIFSANSIERQLETIFEPIVNLRSGGYIVINQTEALVAIDVNSGRATRERGIEQTALKTNLEAADEAARQMRLRDLAGLIVIDFIDMEDSKNDRAVEKRMKDALRFDRARLQMGKISNFGLMEISRQRRRTSVLEGSSHVCEHCGGAGRVRSIESSALRLLRALDDEAMRRPSEVLEARAPADVAIYVLNEKRETLARLEERRGVQVRVVAAPNLLPPDFELASLGARAYLERDPNEARAPEPAIVEPEDDDITDLVDEDEDEEEIEESEESEESVSEAEAGEDGEAVPASAANGEEADRRRRRRRGRRGGKRRREEGGEEAQAGAVAAFGETEEGEAGAEEGEEPQTAEPVAANGEPRTGRRRRRRRGRGGGNRTNTGANGEPQPFLEDVAYMSEQEFEAEVDDEEEEDLSPAVTAASATIEAAAPAPMEAAAPAPHVYAPVEPEAVEAEEPEESLEPDVALPELPRAPALATESDYAPDQERREKFFARLSRWGKKEAI